MPLDRLGECVELAGLDPTTNLLAVGLLGLPALFSVGVAAFAALKLPRDTTVSVVIVSILTGAAYQTAALLPAIAVDDASALFWGRFLGWSAAAMAASGLHFMLLLNEVRWATRFRLVFPLYGGALLVLAAHMAELTVTEVVPHSVFGRGLAFSGPGDAIQRAYGGLCILLLAGFAVRYFLRWRAHPVRGRSARLIAGGLLLPIIGGIAVVTRATDIPVYHVTLPLFHVCLVLAIRWHGLLMFSIEDTARPAIDALTEGLLVVDPKGRLQYANRHAREVYSLGDAELGNRLPEDSPLARGIEAALTGADERGVAVDFRGVASLASFALLSHRGRPYVAVALTDVRHLRDAERELVEAREDAVRAQNDAEAASRAKSTFLANMSHELRTPLNAIIGYGELLSEDADTETQADLGRIIDSGQYLLALLDDVLDLSKLDAGRLSVRTEPFDIAATVHELEAAVRILVAERGNQLEIEAPPATVIGDPKRVRQVLLNLLSNAAKFTSDGTVRITVEPGESTVAVRVSDTGIGMDAAQQARLFTRFEQVHDSAHGEYGGTGLGLPLSGELATRMGGRLEVESAPGEGSTFTLVLPTPA